MGIHMGKNEYIWEGEQVFSKYTNETSTALPTTFITPVDNTWEPTTRLDMHLRAPTAVRHLKKERQDFYLNMSRHFVNTSKQM